MLSLIEFDLHKQWVLYGPGAMQVIRKVLGQKNMVTLVVSSAHGN